MTWYFDGHTYMEAKIGKFKNAIVPNTNTSRDFIAELRKRQVRRHQR